MGDTPKELQSEFDRLSQEAATLEQRFTAVGEQLGQARQKKPSLGDRLKAAFRPGKETPLAKLTDEREQIMQAIASNRRERDLATQKLNDQTKKESQSQPKPEAVEPPTVQQQGVSQSPPSPRQVRQDPLRSSLGPSAYAASLEPETPITRKPNPLRSDLGQDAYAPSLQSGPPKRGPDPLRSNLGQDAYAPSLQPELPTAPKQVPLQPNVASRGYASSLQPDSTILRPEVDANGYQIDQQGQSEDVLAPKVDANGYQIDQQGQSEDELAPDGPQVGEEQVGSKFKMKSMEERYVKGEKQAPSTTVKVGDKDVTVQQKDWLRDVVNDDRRGKGLKEVSKERWDNDPISRQQATTQYYNDQQRAEHEVSLDGGKLKNGAGNLQEGSHIFVMDGQGQLYAEKAANTTSQVDDRGLGAHVHHSSFLAGEDVAGAGEVRIDKDGTLKEVTDRSGHYKPGEEQTKQTLEAIDQQGVSLDNVKFTLDRGAEKTGGMAREFLQGQVTPEEQQHREELLKSGHTVRDTCKAMEETFNGRHKVADQIKGKGESVRDSLRKTDNLEGLEHRAEQQGKKQGFGRVK